MLRCRWRKRAFFCSNSSVAKVPVACYYYRLLLPFCTCCRFRIDPPVIIYSFNITTNVPFPFLSTPSSSNIALSLLSLPVHDYRVRFAILLLLLHVYYYYYYYSFWNCKYQRAAAAVVVEFDPLYYSSRFGFLSRSCSSLLCSIFNTKQKCMITRRVCSTVSIRLFIVSHGHTVSFSLSLRVLLVLVFLRRRTPNDDTPIPSLLWSWNQYLIIQNSVIVPLSPADPTFCQLSTKIFSPLRAIRYVQVVIITPVLRAPFPQLLSCLYVHNIVLLLL